MHRAGRGLHNPFGPLLRYTAYRRPIQPNLRPISSGERGTQYHVSGRGESPSEYGVARFRASPTANPVGVREQGESPVVSLPACSVSFEYAFAVRPPDQLGRRARSSQSNVQTPPTSSSGNRMAPIWTRYAAGEDGDSPTWSTAPRGPSKAVRLSFSYQGVSECSCRSSFPVSR